MHCLGFCVIGASLLGSMIVIMLNKDSPADVSFRSSLSSEQLDKFQDIRKQRSKLYCRGLLLGLAIAIVYMYLFDHYDMFMKSCMTTAIIFGVAHLYYMFSDKDMMLDHLDSPEQVKLYTDLYKQYRYNGTLGSILGIVGFLLLQFGLRKGLE